MIKWYLFILSIAHCLIFAQDPERYLIIANEKMTAGELSAADSLLNESLKIDPTFAPAIVAQSKIWLRKGDIKKAIFYGSKAVKLDEDTRPWADELTRINNKMISAMNTFKNREVEKSISELEMITQDYPYFVQPYYNMAVIKYKTNDPDGMAYYAKKLLSFNRDHIKGKKLYSNAIKFFYKVGNESFSRGDLTKAEMNFKKAIEYDKNYIPAYYQLGVIEKKMGNSSKAKSFFNQILNIDSLHFKTLFTFGALYESEGDLDSAMILYKESIASNHKFIKPYSSLGNIFVGNGEFDLAKQILFEAIEIDPNYSVTYITLGYALSEEAKELNQKLNSSDFKTKSKIKIIDESNKLYVEASKYLKIATEIDSKNHDVWHRYATVLNSIKDFNKASDAAQKCIDLKNNYGGGYYEKGVALFGMGKKQRALKFLEDANKDRDFRAVAQRKIDEIKNPTKYEK